MSDPGSLRRVGVAVVLLAVAAGLLVLPLEQPAEAWKPPSHLFTAEHALLDVISDGKVTIPDVSGDPSKAVTVAANPVIVEALQKYPEVFRAGVVGPDAFPDVVFGQSAIHPDTRTANDSKPPQPGDVSFSDEWLRYVWEQANDTRLWAVTGAHPAGWERILEQVAFALGYLNHSNGDTWSHTWVNQPAYAGGVFPDLTDDMEHGAFAVRHVIVENYVDKHRPGYNAHAYQLRVPEAFVSDTLLTSEFARSHGDHPVLDPLLHKLDQVHRDAQEVRFDNENQDCLNDQAADCTRVEHLGNVHFVCEQSGCTPDPTDSPLNVIEYGADLLLQAYLEAWRDDLFDGFRAWVKVQETVANELHAGGRPELQPITDAVHEWVHTHLLSMMGFPDFVGNGSWAVNQLLSAVNTLLFSCDGAIWGSAKQDPTFGTVFGPLCDLYGQAKADIEAAVADIADSLLAGMFTRMLHLDELDADTFAALDLDSNGKIQPSEAIILWHEPEDYLADTRLFPAGTRAKIHQDMGAGDHTQENDLLDLFTPYQPDVFTPLKNTMVHTQLSMLDQAGLNAYFQAKAAQAGIKVSGLKPLYRPYETTHPGVTWHVPNNVSLGWTKSMDADHQWRVSSLYSFPHDGGAVRSHGLGAFWLWEDCVSRQVAWPRTFHQPVAGHDAFDDDGDSPSARTDDAPPALTLGLDGTMVEVGSTTFVGGGSSVSASAQDAVWPDSALAIEHRVTAPGDATPTEFTSSATPTAIPLDRGDGSYTVEVRAADACALTSALQTRQFTVDSTPPEITISKPTGTLYDTDDVDEVVFSAADAGSGVDTVTATLDGAAITSPHLLDMFFLEPGLRTIVITAADRIGNTASSQRQFTVRATAESLRSNVDRALQLGLITDPAVHEGLVDKLDAAVKAHDRGQHATEHKQLAAFIQQLQGQRGLGIDADTADRFIRYAQDLIDNGG